MVNDENKDPEYRLKPVRLQKVEDYLKLVGMRIAISLKERDPVLRSNGIDSAIVQGLSDTGTHLILKQVRISKKGDVRISKKGDVVESYHFSRI